jgi:hypothetical protein
MSGIIQIITPFGRDWCTGSALRARGTETMRPPAAEPPTTPIHRATWKMARPSG